MVSTEELLRRRSHPADTQLLGAELNKYLSVLDGWILQDEKLVRSIVFQNFYQTMAFVNAVAYIVHREDHHPEMLVTYNRCTIRFYTHSLNSGRGGISENDFICAAKINALVGSEN